MNVLKEWKGRAGCYRAQHNCGASAVHFNSWKAQKPRHLQTRINIPPVDETPYLETDAGNGCSGKVFPAFQQPPGKQQAGQRATPAWLKSAPAAHSFFCFCRIHFRPASVLFSKSICPGNASEACLCFRTRQQPHILCSCSKRLRCWVHRKFAATAPGTIWPLRSASFTIQKYHVHKWAKMIFIRSAGDQLQHKKNSTVFAQRFP